MCILGASLTIAAQNIIYGNKNEQRAINMAFDILQVYYHSKELCVSDSIYDLDWDIFQIWLILRPNKFSGLIE